MWQDAVAHIDQWGRNAVIQANIKAKKQFETNTRNNKTGPAQPVQYRWTRLPCSSIWNSLSFVSDALGLRPPSAQLIDAVTSWSASDFYR
ncbi:hypothetical protein BGZ81_004353, partial [Podila clonocystis]